MTWQTSAGTLLVFLKSEITLFYTKEAYWELSISSDTAAPLCAHTGWWEAKGVLKGHPLLKAQQAECSQCWKWWEWDVLDL